MLNLLLRLPWRYILTAYCSIDPLRPPAEAGGANEVPAG
jgi:hypothetical protein